MKPLYPLASISAILMRLGFGCALGLAITIGPCPLLAQSTPAGAEKTEAIQAAKKPDDPVPAKPAGAAPAPPATPESAASASAPTTATTSTPAPGVPTAAITSAADKTATTTNKEPASVTNEDIQLSFQGANIDMIVQWLAKTTGKSVIKHPRVQCQLNIVSSKKLPPREAVNLVYRALALESFAVVENRDSIFIVPEGSEPKISPELIDSSHKDLPEGRQRLVRIFPLQYIPGSELKEKLKAILTDKGTIELSDRSNQIIVTDYTDNIRLLSEMIKELDVPSSSDTVVEFYSLKHSEAEDLAALLSLVLNAQAGTTGSSSKSSSSRGPGGPMPGGPMPSPGDSSSPASGQTGPQSVKIWSDKVSNRLIVSAPKSRLPEIQQLIQILDTEKPEDVGLRVIPLKNVNAEDLVKEIGPLYQKMSGKSLKDTIEVTANTRSNSLIILSSEVNFKALEKLIAGLDTDDAQEKVMRAFPLKNADAEDVAKQMQELNQDQDSGSRYPFFIFSSSSMGNKNSKKVSVVADRRRNTVIVQCPPAAMENLAKMIQELDEPIKDNGLAPKIFPLKYVSATDIEDVLNELFLKKQQTRTYWDPYNPPQDTTGSQGGRLYGKVRITSEPYSNAIIVTSNSPENLAAVEEVLRQLDVPSEAGETTFRTTLKFAKATTVASSVNILFAKGGAPPLRAGANPQQDQNGQIRPPQQQATSSQSSFGLEQEAKEDAYFPWIGGQQEISRTSDGRNASRPISDLVGRVRVVPDKRSNSLLITCNVHLYPQVLKLITELDAPTAQVLIEARIIEVSSDFRDRLGVRWSPDGGKTYNSDDLDNSLQIKSDATYKKVFAGNALADSLRSGVLSSSVNLDILIQFLRKNTDSRVLAEPQINIADNEVGKLFVGSQVPFISGSLNTDVGGRNDTFQYRDVGIILEVTPHINDSDEVALKIRAESSSIRTGETLFGGAILDTRNFRTDVMVKSGQTVVLGGIIQRETTDTMRKTPGLGSIPGLGWAFKKKDKSTREVELMVFLRPRVARVPAEDQQIMDEIEQKVPLIKDWQSEVYTNKAEVPKKARKGKSSE